MQEIFSLAPDTTLCRFTTIAPRRLLLSRNGNSQFRFATLSNRTSIMMVPFSFNGFMVTHNSKTGKFATRFRSVQQKGPVEKPKTALPRDLVGSLFSSFPFAFGLALCDKLVPQFLALGSARNSADPCLTKTGGQAPSHLSHDHGNLVKGNHTAEAA